MDSKQKKLDEKEKIIIISEIDELKVIANNHYLMGKYDDAIKTTEEIIELAKKAELSSIIRQQQKFVNKIHQLIGNQKPFLIDDFEDLKGRFENLLNANKIDDAHEIVASFKEKYNKILNLSSNTVIEELIKKDKKIWDDYSSKKKDIKRQLEPLEIQLNSYLSTNNVILANDIIRKAKELLRKIEDISIKEKWDTLEAMFVELKKKYDFHEKIEDSLQEVTNLTDKYEFDKAKDLLKSVSQIIQEKALPNFEKEIKIKERSIVDAKQKYNKLKKDIEDLEILVEENIKRFLFDEAIDNCNQIIKISRFIGKEDYVNKYSEYIKDIKRRIQEFNEYEKFRMIIINLNSEATDAIKKDNFELALSKFKEIKEKIAQFNSKK
ncbi:MAG: hypothetical protein ACFFFB_12785 [Candidatus Heimdallarchaeota archaeon]